jgi:hypothetical protein
MLSTDNDKKGSMVHAAIRTAVLKYFASNVEPIITEAVESTGFKKVVTKLVRSEIKKQIFEIIKSSPTNEVRSAMKAEVDRLIDSIQRDFTKGLNSSDFTFPIAGYSDDGSPVPDSDFIASQDNFGSFIGSVFLSQIAESAVNESIEQATADHV